ncbi:MAG: hypothetical protein P8181_01500 [bacterium]
MLATPAATIEIPTADIHPVRGDLYIPPGNPAGLVVLCHGFKGYKTWGFFPYVAGRLRDAGLAAVSIDFSFNGTLGVEETEEKTSGSAHPLTVYVRPDLFRANTLKRERADLASVMRFITEGKLDAYLKGPAPVGLFGHSRGGVVAFLHAVEHRDVDALCTWSIPASPDIFDARQIEKWRRQGEYDFTNAADGTRLSVAVDFLDDLYANHDLYDLRRQAPRLRTPHLIVHGELDLAVDVEQARSLFDAEESLDDKRLLIVRTGHLFGIPYPPLHATDAFPGPARSETAHPSGSAAAPSGEPSGRNQRAPATGDPPAALVKAADATVDWFSTHLGKGE